MNAKILITLPQHDEATRYLYAWTGPLIKYARKIKSSSSKNLPALGRKIKVSVLKKNKVKAHKLVKRVKKFKPIFLFFNGHGSPTELFGQKELLVSIYSNLKLLADKIVYARSCDSASKLGPKAVLAGTKAYIGYKEPFIFLYDPKRYKRPSLDQTAALFLKPTNLLVQTLLDGKTANEANEAGKKAMQDNINHLLTSESDPQQTSLIRYLFWNMENQVCLGDKDSKI